MIATPDLVFAVIGVPFEGRTDLIEDAIGPPGYAIPTVYFFFES